MATWAGPPRSYTKGRIRPVQYVVIHSTEGSEGVKSAEAGVAYDKVRTDGTSTHLFVDTDTALMEVRYTDTAHAARAKGNACGIQVELCGRAGQTNAQWHDAASLPMLRLAAREVAQICRDFGLPPRRLSVAEVRAAYYAPASARPKGICGHIDVTRAYPEDGGSHTDPGANFPWSEFLAMVAAAMGGTTEGDDEMAVKLIQYKGYWISYGSGLRANLKTQDVYERAKAMYPTAAYPSVDGNGWASPDLSTLGWTDAQVDAVFGVDSAARTAVDGGGLSEDEVRDIAAEEAREEISGTRLVPPAN